MITCATCNAENIEGTDVCEACGQPFSDTHLIQPATEVERSLLADRVAVLSPRPPIVVASETKVKDALDILVEKEIGCLLVVDEGKLVGIFSERDAIMRINTDVEKFADQPISTVMTTDPKQIPRDAKVAYAVKFMDLEGVRHLPVMSPSGQADGIISVRDILRYLTEKMTA